MSGSKGHDMAGARRAGKPVGMSPSIGASGRANQTRAVPAIRAISGDGSLRLTPAGVKITMARDTAPTPKACQLTLATMAGRSPRAPMIPPEGAEWPINRGTCKMMMMTPMPLMKPEITVNGTKLMNWPSLKIPKRI